MGRNSLTDPQVRISSIMMVGGAFLIYKATHEIHVSLEGEAIGKGYHRTCRTWTGA